MKTQEAVDLWLARFGTRWTTPKEAAEVKDDVFWYDVYKCLETSTYKGPYSDTHTLEGTAVILFGGTCLVYRLNERKYADR